MAGNCWGYKERGISGMLQDMKTESERSRQFLWLLEGWGIGPLCILSTSFHTHLATSSPSFLNLHPHCPRFIYVPVMKHPGKNQLQEKGFILAYNSKVQSFIARDSQCSFWIPLWIHSHEQRAGRKTHMLAPSTHSYTSHPLGPNP